MPEGLGKPSPDRSHPAGAREHGCQRGGIHHSPERTSSEEARPPFSRVNCVSRLEPSSCATCLSEPAFLLYSQRLTINHLRALAKGREQNSPGCWVLALAQPRLPFLLGAAPGSATRSLCDLGQVHSPLGSFSPNAKESDFTRNFKGPFGP